MPGALVGDTLGFSPDNFFCVFCDEDGLGFASTIRYDAALYDYSVIFLFVCDVRSIVSVLMSIFVN